MPTTLAAVADAERVPIFAIIASRFMLRLLVIILTLARAHTGFAQPTVLRPADAPRPREGWRLVDGVWIRPAGTFQFKQLVSTAIRDHRLVVSIAPDKAWKPKLINARRIIAEAEADKTLWWMMLTQTTQIVAPTQRGASLVLMPAVDRSANKDVPLRLAGVTVAPGGAIIRGVGQADGRFVQVEYRAARDGRSPRLTVVTPAGRGFDFTGRDLVDLLNKDAPVVRRFLAPLLKELADEDLLRPRAADVYRALPEIEPTAEEMSQFQAVVAELNSDDPDTRDAASLKLTQIGPPAVLVAVRMNSDRLTPEQAMRVSLFVDDNSLGETDTARVRADAEYLRALDLFPDRRVRELARELLAQFVN